MTRRPPQGIVGSPQRIGSRQGRRADARRKAKEDRAAAKRLKLRMRIARFRRERGKD